MNLQVIQNIQQQTKRLLDQLQELQDNKADLSEEEYREMKQSTRVDLETFQHFLTNCAKGDQILESEVEKSHKQIAEAIKMSFDKNTIMAKVMDNQIQGYRSQIKYLDNQYHLKKIGNAQYFGKKRKLLVDIQEAGGVLTSEDNQWLQLTHFDSNKGDISEKAGNKHMQIAGANIKSLK